MSQAWPRFKKRELYIPLTKLEMVKENGVPHKKPRTTPKSKSQTCSRTKESEYSQQTATLLNKLNTARLVNMQYNSNAHLQTLLKDIVSLKKSSTGNCDNKIKCDVSKLKLKHNLPIIDSEEESDSSESDVDAWIESLEDSLKGVQSLNSEKNTRKRNKCPVEIISNPVPDDLTHVSIENHISQLEDVVQRCVGPENIYSFESTNYSATNEPTIGTIDKSTPRMEYLNGKSCQNFHNMMKVESDENILHPPLDIDPIKKEIKSESINDEVCVILSDSDEEECLEPNSPKGKEDMFLGNNAFKHESNESYDDSLVIDSDFEEN